MSSPSFSANTAVRVKKGSVKKQKVNVCVPRKPMGVRRSKRRDSPLFKHLTLTHATVFVIKERRDYSKSRPVLSSTL